MKMLDQEQANLLACGDMSLEAENAKRFPEVLIEIHTYFLHGGSILSKRLYAFLEWSILYSCIMHNHHSFEADEQVSLWLVRGVGQTLWELT